MKKNFDECLKMLLKHEGGFVNHPKDPGGMTNLGVTKAVYDKWTGKKSTEEDMRALTVEDVSPIYRKNYWDRCYCDALPSGADWSVFDWAVNSGTGRASKALQKIVGATQDGAIGPKTLQLVANQSPEFLVEKMYYQRQSFYEKLNTFETFGKGWTRRNKETKEKAMEMI